MAKSKKKKARKGALSVNFTGVEAGGNKHIKPSTYIAKCTGAELKDGSAAQFFHWGFEVTEGKEEGWKAKFVTSLKDDSLWSLKGVLLALGVAEKDLQGDFEVDPSDHEDQEVMITVEDALYNGRTVSSIVYVGDANDAETDDDNDGDADGDAEYTADDINEMKKSELAELIEAEELDLDTDDFKGKGALDKLREAVIEELELSDDGKNDGDDDLYTEDQVNKMKRKEVEALIDEEELSVKPDNKKLKDIKKLRQAVIDALEEEELLEED